MKCKLQSWRFCRFKTIKIALSIHFYKGATKIPSCSTVLISVLATHSLKLTLRLVFLAKIPTTVLMWGVPDREDRSGNAAPNQYFSFAFLTLFSHGLLFYLNNHRHRCTMVKIKGKRLKMGKNQAALLAKCFAKKCIYRRMEEEFSVKMTFFCSENKRILSYIAVLKIMLGIHKKRWHVF